MAGAPTATGTAAAAVAAEDQGAGLPVGMSAEGGHAATAAVGGAPRAQVAVVALLIMEHILVLLMVQLLQT